MVVLVDDCGDVESVVVVVEKKIEVVDVAVVVNLQDFLRLPNQEDLRLKVENISKFRQSEVRVGLGVLIRMRSLPLGPQVERYMDLLPKTMP